MNLRDAEALSMELDQLDVSLWLSVVTFETDDHWDFLHNQMPISEEGDHGILFNPIDRSDVPDEVASLLEENGLGFEETSMSGSALYVTT